MPRLFSPNWAGSLIFISQYKPVFRQGSGKVCSQWKDTQRWKRGSEDSVKLRIQHEASVPVPWDLLCSRLEKIPKAPSSNSPQCPVFFLQMLTYILSFLPLSDQKEASLVSRAWYCAVQNALREVRCHPHLVHSQLCPTSACLWPCSYLVHSLMHTYSHIHHIHTHLALGTVQGPHSWIRHSPLP